MWHPTQMRERDEAHEAAPPLLHAHRIDGNTQQPGFGVKVHATSSAGSIKRSQGLLKGILGEILALLPVPGQAIDGMEDQFAVCMDQDFDHLDSRQCFHTQVPFRVGTVVLQYTVYTYTDA